MPSPHLTDPFCVSPLCPLFSPTDTSPLSFPCGSAGKESACDAGDLGSSPGLGRSPREGKGCPLQYPGLENSMDHTLHGVAKSQTQLRDFHVDGQRTKPIWPPSNPGPEGPAFSRK